MRNAKATLRQKFELGDLIAAFAVGMLVGMLVVFGLAGWLGVKIVEEVEGIGIIIPAPTPNPDERPRNGTFHVTSADAPRDKRDLLTYFKQKEWIIC